MKSLTIVFAAILIVGAQAFTEEQKKRLEQLSGECVKESNVDPEVLKKAVEGSFQDDPKLKVHALCFSKKIGLQNGNGDLQEGKVKERLSQQMKNPGEVDKLVNLCLIKKGTPEDTAWESLKCFRKNSPENVAIF